MQRVAELIERVAATMRTCWCLANREPEKMHRPAHPRPSPRRDRPFVKIDCAALPEELLESELFGYEKGAFTGATEAKPGRFEAADGGTLVLDEIASLARHPRQSFCG